MLDNLEVSTHVIQLCRQVQKGCKVVHASHEPERCPFTVTLLDRGSLLRKRNHDQARLRVRLRSLAICWWNLLRNKPKLVRLTDNRVWILNVVATHRRRTIISCATCCFAVQVG